MAMTRLPLELLSEIGALACEEYEGACAVQQTCKELRSICHTIQSEKMARFRTRNNLWVQAYAYRGMRRGPSGIVDVFMSHAEHDKVQNVQAYMEERWNVSKAALYIDTMCTTRSPILASSDRFVPLSPGQQHLITVEQWSTPLIGMYKCSMCGCVVSSTLRYFVSKHRHKQSARRSVSHMRLVSISRYG